MSTLEIPYNVIMSIFITFIFIFYDKYLLKLVSHEHGPG